MRSSVTWKSIAPMLPVIHSDTVRSSESFRIFWRDWVETKLELFFNPVIQIYTLLIYQFFLLYYTFNRGQKESCNKALFNFTCFLNSEQNFPLQFYISGSTEENAESVNIIFSLDIFWTSHFYIFCIFFRYISFL